MSKIPPLDEAAKVISKFVAQSAEQVNYRKTLLDDMKFGRDSKAEFAEQLARVREMIDAIDDLSDTLKNAGPALAKMEMQAKKDAAILDVALKAGGASPPLKGNAPFLKDLLDALAKSARRLDFARVETIKVKAALSVKNDLKGTLRPGNFNKILNGLHDMSEELTKAHKSMSSFADYFASDFR